MKCFSGDADTRCGKVTRLGGRITVKLIDKGKSSLMFSSVYVRCCGVIVLSLLLSSGCALSGQKDPPSASFTDAAVGSQAEQPPEYEAQLAESLKRDLRDAGRRPERSTEKIVFKKPYFYKEYFIYPSDEDGFTLDFTERESRTTPLSAEANIEKYRFATKMHRKREDARLDENFIRDTGNETISYELRNGRWHRLGSLYVATKTEEIIGGEWQPIVERATPLILEAEEPKGGLRRLMFWR